MKSKSHLNNVALEKKKSEEAEKVISQNHKAGMNVGRQCYNNIKIGRPERHFESDLLILRMSGATIGNINHSRIFIENIRPVFARQIRNKCKNFFTSPMKQTGHRPPCAVSGDIGTWKHRSRQFVGVTSPNPDGDNLLYSLPVSEDLLPNGQSGMEKCNHIVKG